MVGLADLFGRWGVRCNPGDAAVHNQARITVRSLDKAELANGGTVVLAFQGRESTRNFSNPTFRNLGLQKSVNGSRVRKCGAPGRFAMTQIHVRLRRRRSWEQGRTWRHRFINAEGNAGHKQINERSVRVVGHREKSLQQKKAKRLTGRNMQQLLKFGLRHTQARAQVR